MTGAAAPASARAPGSGTRAGERGFVVIELLVGIVVLVLPVGLLVLTFPTWSERQATARSIAREVGRSLARDLSCDADAGGAIADEMARNLGLVDDELRVDVSCDAVAGRLAADATVRVAVTVHMPGVEVPAIGSLGAWSWTAVHRQPVDAYVSAP